MDISNESQFRKFFHTLSYGSTNYANDTMTSDFIFLTILSIKGTIINDVEVKLFDHLFPAAYSDTPQWKH